MCLYEFVLGAREAPYRYTWLGNLEWPRNWHTYAQVSFLFNVQLDNGYCTMVSGHLTTGEISLLQLPQVLSHCTKLAATICCPIRAGAGFNGFHYFCKRTPNTPSHIPWLRLHHLIFFPFPYCVVWLLVQASFIVKKLNVFLGFPWLENLLCVEYLVCATIAIK